MYDWMPRYYTRIRQIVMISIYSVLYIVSTFILLWFSKLCIEEGLNDRLNNFVKGFGIGLAGGFAISEAFILFSVFMKTLVFRARKRGRCGRCIESIFTELRTCVIFNDYRALAFKFEERSKQN